MTVRNSAARQRSDMRVGVGLANTRERLKTLFEEDYELELIHADDGSVVARVRIPLHRIRRTGGSVSIRALIVDDEPYARERLRELCALEPDVAVVGEASHGVEAIEQVEAARPNLLLLDVQMRGTNGFDSAGTTERREALVVFVSAHDQYAQAAFGVEAVDYLLRAVRSGALPPCIQSCAHSPRGRREGHSRSSTEITNAVRETVISVAGRTPVTNGPKRIVAERDGRMFFISQPDIDSVRSEPHYVNITAGRTTSPSAGPCSRRRSRWILGMFLADSPVGDREYAQDSGDGAAVSW